MASGMVLVVDDDQAIREALSAALMGEGYVVVEARDGGEALALAAASSPDVVLLDMRMPVMDGWVFTHEYRRRTRAGAGAAIVCMTAAAGADGRAWEIAAEGVLAKPFDLDDLLAVVARCRAAP